MFYSEKLLQQVEAMTYRRKTQIYRKKIQSEVTDTIYIVYRE